MLDYYQFCVRMRTYGRAANENVAEIPYSSLTASPNKRSHDLAFLLLSANRLNHPCKHEGTLIALAPLGRKC